MKILSFSYLVLTQDILFNDVEYQQRYQGNPFALGGAYLTPFCQLVQQLFVQHMDKITCVNVTLKFLYLSQV